MKKNAFLLFAFVVLTLFGCNKDDESITPVVIAFVNQSVNLSESESQVNIVFSNPTTASGTISLTITPTDLVYGTDFTTNPTASNGTIVVPFGANATSASFTFRKLIDAIEGQIKNVKFTITAVSITSVEIPASTNFTQLNFNETAISNNILSPVNGGNTLPNQVYIDLSSGVTTPIVRTAWDLGFYSGNEFRVTINGAINKFSVKQLATTNIDEVQSQDVNVTVGNFDPAGTAYVDHPYGNLSGTAIAEVSSTDADNKVYLVNLGQDIATTPATGTSVALTGTSRGWKKIRILKSGNDYKLQYANIDATTHNEITISKNTAYNFSFFSFNTNTAVSAEPKKEKWDLNLSTFTNFTQYNGQDVSYFYPDFAVTNTKAGTRVYQVLTSDFAYATFTLANVATANFDTDAAKDRRAIGANWRATNPLQLKTDRFYVVKDAAGNIYKLKFTAMQNASGERGNVTFEYKKL
jgi:hypothetical protein